MSDGAFHLLLLVLAANSAPVLMARIMGQIGTWPIDAGRSFLDGRRILGASKTWRGLAAALVASATLSTLLGYGFSSGLVAATAAMFGDMLSSFIKRRLKLESSAQAPLLDQVPESLFPALALRHTFELGWLDIGLVTLTFILLEVIFSRIFFYLGVRKRPY